MGSGELLHSKKNLAALKIIYHIYITLSSDFVPTYTKLNLFKVQTVYLIFILTFIKKF